jgi:Na+/proline symporter
MIGKFYAIKDTAAIKRGTIISTIFCIVIGCGAYLIGSTSRLILGGVLPEGGIDSVIPAVLMEVLGGGTLGIILLAVIMILLLSASMSTLEAVVLTSASAVAVDLIPSVRKKETKPEIQMLLTRLLCLAFVACSFIFATQNIPIIVSLMSFSWGIVSGCFIGPYLWGLFSKKITKAGAYAGILSGLMVVGISTLVISLNSGFAAAAAKSPEMGVAAMAVSLIIVPLVSTFTKNKDTERIEEIFTCYNEDYILLHFTIISVTSVMTNSLFWLKTSNVSSTIPFFSFRFVRLDTVQVDFKTSSAYTGFSHSIFVDLPAMSSSPAKSISRYFAHTDIKDITPGAIRFPNIVDLAYCSSV